VNDLNKTHLNHQVGDVVVLKSGSPPMTIHDIDDYGPTGPNPGILCVWFLDGKREESVFHPATLARHPDA
jgi:uncharacterized protein YodC (DUF2158 family)